MYLAPLQFPKSSRQRRRFCVVLGVPAVVEFSYGGFAVGGSDSSRLRGFLGNGQDQSKANAETVRFVDFQHSRTDSVTENITNRYEKFLRVENELAAFKPYQSE